MKFLHTADWQIGMKAAHVGAAGARVRAERLAAAGRVVDAAREHGAEFILVAGDTFEDNGVERVAVQQVADILGRFGGPVYVIPGNHDPLEPGSVWEHPAWGSAGSVHILREARPVDLPGGVLYPCPVREKRSSRDPTSWIPLEASSGVRIALAHGTVMNVHIQEPEYPIPPGAAERLGLDFLALGHWHSTAIYQEAGGAARAAYSGTHEPTGFDEHDSGNALVVEIARHGDPPLVQPVRTGRLVWTTAEDEVRAPGDLRRVRERVEKMPDPDITLLDLRVRGVLSAQDGAELARVREVVQARFLFGRIDASGLLPAPADDQWVSDLPVGILRQAAERLRELANPTFAGARPEGALPKVAARALLELYTLKAEGPR